MNVFKRISRSILPDTRRRFGVRIECINAPARPNRTCCDHGKEARVCSEIINDPSEWRMLQHELLLDRLRGAYKITGVDITRVEPETLTRSSLDHALFCQTMANKVNETSKRWDFKLEVTNCTNDGRWQ